jgi:integrase
VGTVSLDLFFRNEDGSCLNPTNVSQGFLYEWKHAGLGKGISIHSLRHLHASRLLEGDDKKGIKPQDLTWVAERLGDHEATIAKTYAHILDKNARARRGVDDISALYAAS